MASDNAKRNEILFKFLREGKAQAEDRIRTCQILLNDPTVEGDLRESLEAIRANAEDDFGTFLHLTTVHKVPAETPKALVDPSSSLNAR